SATRDPQIHLKRRGAKILNRERICQLFHLTPDDITDFVVFEPANAIKFTIRRVQPSGSPGEHDVFGSQQYPPLFDLDVP
ncbi:MAG: DUF4387 family protein, partial [Proteobacteria bacterium]|nr:DUF4387 family protein [Pseudomonadota bacterium]